MELCEIDLRRWLCQNQVVEEEVTFSIFIQLVKGLERLHGNQILHRDLKPDNIFLVTIRSGSSSRAGTGTGSSSSRGGGRENYLVAKIGDLGIATSHTVSTASAKHTRGVGTPHYLAPEQNTAVYGKPADLYALGLILFELLDPSMQPGHNNGAYDRLIGAFNELKYQRKLPHEIQIRWPKVCRLILQLTAVDPSRRPKYAEILATFLLAPPPPPPTSPTPAAPSSSVVHYGVTCDGCRKENIQGIRYKCSKCPDYDLCEDCENVGRHTPDHPLLKIRKPDSGQVAPRPALIDGNMPPNENIYLLAESYRLGATCTICGKFARRFYHCSVCPEHDYCIECMTASPHAISIGDHMSRHTFLRYEPSCMAGPPMVVQVDVEKNRARLCNLCGEMVTDWDHCTVCPDYDYCLSCSTGGPHAFWVGDHMSKHPFDRYTFNRLKSCTVKVVRRANDFSAYENGATCNLCGVLVAEWDHCSVCPSYAYCQLCQGGPHEMYVKAHMNRHVFTRRSSLL